MTKQLGIVLAIGVLGFGACGGGDDDDDDNDVLDVDAAPGQPDAPPGDPDAAPIVPVLDAIDPTTGLVGTTVTLDGSNFGAAQGASTVNFGATQATVTTWSDTQIVATVPDVFPGDTDVTVTVGGATSDPRVFDVILPPMIYLNNDSPDASSLNTLTIMAFDPATGALTEDSSSPVQLGAGPTSYGGCSSSAVLHEGTRRLFATSSNMVDVFDIDPQTGALTAVTGSPFDTGSTQNYGVTVNTAGTRLFVADYAGTIAVLDISAAGALTAVTGSPFTVSTDVDTPVLSGDEAFLYANNESGGFEAFSIAGDGALTAVAGSPFNEGNFSYAMMLRPGHPQIYITDDTVGLMVYAYDETTGVPAQITGSPFAAAPPTGNLHHPAFTPDANRVYVGGDNGGYMQAFDLAADGTPTELTASPYDLTATMTDVSCLHMSEDGTYLLAIDEGQKEVAVFTFDVDGTPTHVTGSPFAHTTPNENASGLAATF